MKAYTVFMLLALATVFGGALYSIRKDKVSSSHAVVLLGVSAVVAFVGARLMHFVTDYSRYAETPSRLYALDFSGFSLFGGIIGGTVAAAVFAKIYKLNFWRLADLAAPFLGLGIVFLRIGCFLNGCCFGRETGLPWGMRFPFWSTPHRYQILHDPASLFFVNPVHPTQLYELLAAAVGIALAVFILRKKLFDGAAILVFVTWFSAFRIVNDQLRVAAPNFSAPNYFYPALYLILIAVCAIAFHSRIKKSHSRGESGVGCS